MVSADLIDYLSGYKKENTPFETIAASLRTAGYTDAQIAEAHAWYTTPPASSLSQTPHYPASKISMPKLPFNIQIPSRKKPLAIAGVVICLFVVMGIFLIAAYGSLPIGTASTRAAMADFIVGLPFMPKTPEYVVRSSLKTHTKITKFNLDASVAITGNAGGIASALGTQDIDIAVKGPVDYSDPKNPRIALNVAFTKQFDADVMLINKSTYFRFNNLPSFLGVYLAFLGMNDSMLTKLEHRWFYYTTQKLNTEARKQLDSSQDQRSVTQKTTQGILNALDNPAIRSHLSISSDTIDSFATYHLRLKGDNDTLAIINQSIGAEFGQKPSTGKIKPLYDTDGFVMDSWIDKRSYYVRKVAVSFTLKQHSTNSILSLLPKSPSTSSYGRSPISPLSSQNIPVVAVLKLSDFDKIPPIEKPAHSEKIEDALKELESDFRHSASSSGLFTKQYGQANNTKRQSDVLAILNAIDQYKGDNGGNIALLRIPKFPTTISTVGVNLCSILVPKYIETFPVDPLTNNGIPVINCS